MMHSYMHIQMPGGAQVPVMHPGISPHYTFLRMQQKRSWGDSPITQNLLLLEKLFSCFGFSVIVHIAFTVLQYKEVGRTLWGNWLDKFSPLPTDFRQNGFGSRPIRTTDRSV